MFDFIKNIFNIPRTTRFYQVSYDTEIKSHHKVIKFHYMNCTYLVNFTNKELNNIHWTCLLDKNFQNWSERQKNYDPDLYEFLKTKKHKFKKSYKGFSSDGYNYFDFTDEDIMYMKLMGWMK